MKPLLLLVCLLLFSGCQQKVDTTPVWQTTLPGSGVDVAVANCTVEVGNAVYLTEEGEEIPAILLQAEGIPVLTVRGGEEEQIAIDFAKTIGEQQFGRERNSPMPKLDYVLSVQEDGTLQFRFDTVYQFYIEISGEEGSDAMVLVCHRVIE